MRQIEGYPLWLGSIRDVRDAKALYGEGIAAVVDLAVNELPAVLPRELLHCRFPLTDGGENPSWLLLLAAETVATLIRAEVPTLVYCGAGMSRTPAIAASGLALATEISPRAALARVGSGAAADVSPALWADIQSALALK